MNRSGEEALQQIVALESEGKIRFVTQSQTLPFKFAEYLKTGEAHWYWIVIFFTLMTSLVMFAVPENLQPWSYLRNVLGIIFVIYTPGYTFMKALFPTKMSGKSSKEKLDRTERIVFGLGMSLFIVTIIGLFLNYTPWGMNLFPIVLSLTAFSGIFASTALIREYQVTTKKSIL